MRSIEVSTQAELSAALSAWSAQDALIVSGGLGRVVLPEDFACSIYACAPGIETVALGRFRAVSANFGGPARLLGNAQIRRLDAHDDVFATAGLLVGPEGGIIMKNLVVTPGVLRSDGNVVVSGFFFTEKQPQGEGNLICDHVRPWRPREVSQPQPAPPETTRGTSGPRRNPLIPSAARASAEKT